MRIFGKIIFSAVIHLIWFFLVMFASIMMINSFSDVYRIMLEPYMTLIVYPLAANLIIYLNYKKVPLSTMEEKKQYVYTSGVFTLLLLVWLLFLYGV